LFYIVWVMRVGPYEMILINLIPFHTIKLFINALLHGYAPLYIIAANLLGNIILTFPIGMLISRLFGFIKIHNILFLAFYFPMNIELFQLFLLVIGYSTRSVNINNLLLNECVIIIGNMLCFSIKKDRPIPVHHKNYYFNVSINARKESKCLLIYILFLHIKIIS